MNEDLKAPPALILLPGLGGTGELFSPLLAALGNSAESVVLAYPPDRFLNYEQLTALVRAQLPSKRPFVILAESFSGPIGISIAADAPKQMKGLILCCTFARFPNGAFRQLGRALRFLPSTRPPNMFIEPLLMGRWRTPELSQSLRSALFRVDPQVLRARALEALAADMTGRASEISVPTLCLTATQDRLVSKAAQAVLMNANPAIKCLQLAGPHFLLQCNPNASATEIRRFLTELATA